jgi:activator of HSP90 ATPase
LTLNYCDLYRLAVSRKWAPYSTKEEITKNSFSISARFDVAPNVLYTAWLNSKEHSKFTGSGAKIDPKVGGKFIAWDGYIYGITREKEENKRIVQSWRTTEFAKEDPDSKREILFEKTKNGTKLILKHSEIPKGQAEEYKKGGGEYYFKLMKEYYSKK